MHSDEGFLDSIVMFFIEGIFQTRPVKRSAHGAHLGNDNALVFESIVIYEFNKLLTFIYVVIAGDLFFFDEFGFCGYGGMVGAWEPEGFPSAHALETDHNVFNSQHKCRTHVEDTRYIWRGQNY